MDIIMGETYLAAVCHDIKSNTLEATWLQATETELKRVKCRNYSVEQKGEFLSDTGEEGDKYIVMAGW
jgi:hypothetical protein